MADLATSPWQDFYSSSDIDFKVAFLTESIRKAYDTHAPYRTFTPKKPPSPWLTAEIKRLISTRNKAWRVFKRNRCEITRARYKYLRNTIKTTIRNARHVYFKNRLRNCSTPADMWKIVREIGICNSKKTIQMPANPDAFNSHFIGSRATIQAAPIQPLPTAVPIVRFDFKPVVCDHVVKALASSRSNALGPDEISLHHLRECCPVILEPLVNIFSASLSSGYFPSDWKRAIVRPLPKSKSVAGPADFRPISILSTASKLLESVALRQINGFVEEENLLNKFQSGFRKGYSTHSAVIRVVDDIKHAIDNKQITLAIGIDFSSAFDLVNIDILISKFRSLLLRQSM